MVYRRLSRQPKRRFAARRPILTPKSPFRAGLRWTTRLVGGLAGLGLSLVLAGAAYEALAARGDAERYPPPGRLVDIGGHRLHIHCQGRGSPTVVFDSGLGGTSLDWTLVHPEIARMTRACTYDRAGLGWSEPGPAPRSARRIAEELHTLLLRSGIAGPYVLVGHSLGGKNVRMFALLYPSEVAGMVLVDARGEYMDFHASAADAAALTQSIRTQSRTFRLARMTGVARLFGAELSGLSALPHATAGLIALFATRERTIATTMNEEVARSDNDVQLRDAPSLGKLPLIVLASGQNMAASADWRAAQHVQAELSTRGRLIVAQGSGHFIQVDRPALVVAAVREVLAAAGKPPIDELPTRP